MLVAIASSENKDLSKVDPHFGRCNWYCLYDTDKGNLQFVENPFRDDTGHAGCDAVDFLAEQGVTLVVAGRFGAKVVERFKSLQIQMIIPENSPTIHYIIQRFNLNKT
jgi:predicted Fe-Mo cluster-binding NifX family protein